MNIHKLGSFIFFNIKTKKKQCYLDVNKNKLTKLAGRNSILLKDNRFIAPPLVLAKRHVDYQHVAEEIASALQLYPDASSKTTEIYTHITTKGFDQIKNPLDNLDI